MRADIKIEKDVPMKRHTSFKVGGVADYFAKPSTISGFLQLLNSIKKNEIPDISGVICKKCRVTSEDRIPLTIIGGGTNLLVKDNGIRGLVISLGYMKNEIKIENINSQQVKVSASAGTNLSTLCRKTIKLGLEDLTFAAGIPGTVGGAVMMNAGTGFGTIADYLTSIDILDRDNNIKTLDKSELIFSHRKLDFKMSTLSDWSDFSESLHKDNLLLKPIILRASFLLTKGSREKVEQSWRTLIEKRRVSQPHGFASAGCFFKNPDNLEQKLLNKPAISAGQLIDMAGLKKKRVGDAVVSDKHANFILNLRNATASEIITLKDIVKESVFQKFGISLSEEVIIKGE